MRTIRGAVESELVINRSRFICALLRAADEPTARGFIADRRTSHWNASHNCTAYRLGEQGEIQRSNDDGEPAGTAGAPMLEVLRQRGLTEVVAVVTRYFGGTKLGAGGLIRAYGKAVTQALDAVGTVSLQRMAVVTVAVDYRHGGSLEAELRRGADELLAARYTDRLEFDVAVADPAAFGAWLAALTAGHARWEVAGSTTVEVRD